MGLSVFTLAVENYTLKALAFAAQLKNKEESNAVLYTMPLKNPTNPVSSGANHLSYT